MFVEQAGMFVEHLFNAINFLVQTFDLMEKDYLDFSSKVSNSLDFGDMHHQGVCIVPELLHFGTNVLDSLGGFLL